MALERGSTLGPYQIVMRLGMGGMGEVYRARDPRLGRDVAIKVLTEEAAQNRDRLRRFVAEAKAASALNHPNILTVHEIGEGPSGPYIVTELVDGSTVRELLSGGPLPVGRALEIGAQAADGVAKAHEAGIVHRDLKPENLMVTRDGFVKILDFGLAKLLRPEASAAANQSATATGMIVGTAGYLSPEQLRGQTADARSDVFSLGIVLYEMVTGDNPFRRENAADTFSAILRDDPPPLSEKGIAVPPALSTVIQRALAKRPEKRFAGSRELGVELKRIRSALDSGVSATQIAPTVTSGRPRRRNLLRVVAGAALLAVIAAALFSRRRPGLPRSVSLPPNQLAVAVLPITNASGDAELERAGIGKILADALVQVLWEVPSLYVISPVRLESVSRSLGEPIARAAADPALAREVSEKSGASAMLTGSLARVGGTYVLSASLTELASERLRGSFRAVATDRERLLTDLVEQVATGVRRQIAPEAPAERLDRVATTDVRAYEHYVRGLEQNITGNWRAAIPELERAITLDPRMGLAWSELACAYSFAGENPKAEAAQKKAEEFLARVNRKERLWIEANGVWVRTRSPEAFQKVYARFIDEFPDDRQGYFYMGLAENYLAGNCKAALSWYEKAYALSPAYYPITNSMVDCHLKLKQGGQAAASLTRYLKLPSLDVHGRQRAQWRLEELNKKAS